MKKDDDHRLSPEQWQRVMDYCKKSGISPSDAIMWKKAKSAVAMHGIKIKL